MKEYPSIPSCSGTSFQEIPNAYIFDKIDGSNIRSEWTKKRGWYKHGRRYGLIDNSNPHLATVPDLFTQTLAEALTKIAVDNKWEKVLVFYEFWGKQSLAGQHQHNDPKFLTIFDACVDNKGFLSPREFLKFFDGKVPTPNFLGVHNWTRGYMNEVYLGRVENITLEGVVAKAEVKNQIVRAKGKTKAWLDLIKNKFSAEEAAKLI